MTRMIRNSSLLYELSLNGAPSLLAPPASSASSPITVTYSGSQSRAS